MSEESNVPLLLRFSRTERTLETPRGAVRIWGPIPPKDLAEMAMDPSLRMFRPPEQQKKALVKIASLPQGAVFAAENGATIIGYCTFHLPDRESRWAGCGLPVLELGALEVASEWRFMRIGRNVLEVAFSSDALDDWIVVSSEYSWHWDLEATRLSVWQYRKLLYAILQNVGLELTPTDDPEIKAHPANMLTVRFGARIPPEARDAFRLIVAGPVTAGR
ncbi:MAG: hypothetical protein ACM3RP_08570 [Chitinophagales bacterium]